MYRFVLKASAFAICVPLAGPTAADVWSTREPLKVGRDTFNVAIASDRTFALVGPGKRSTVLTIRKVERAAAAVTGCQANADRKVSMFVGGRNDEPINMNSVPGGKAVRVRLSC
ncbi:MAG: hypothetical protein AAF393_07320 [Pseudomonadota bacterium]